MGNGNNDEFCPICEKTLKRNNFRRHQEMHFAQHNMLLYECVKCKIRFARSDTYLLHYYEVHLTIPKDDPWYSSKIKDNGDRYYECRKCKHELKCLDNIQMHAVGEHNGEMARANLICDELGRVQFDEEWEKLISKLGIPKTEDLTSGIGLSLFTKNIQTELGSAAPETTKQNESQPPPTNGHTKSPSTSLTSNSAEYKRLPITDVCHKENVP